MWELEWGAQKYVSYVGPERYLERNQNDTLNDTLCVAWKPESPPKLPAPTQDTSGSTTYQNQPSPRTKVGVA